MAQDDTGKLFGALADATCRRLVEIVAKRPMSPATLAEAAGLRAAELKRPLAALLRAGLIRSTDGVLSCVPQAVARFHAFAAALSRPSDGERAAPPDAVDANATAWAREWPAYPADAYAIGQRLLRLAWHVERALKDAAASAELVAVDLLLLDALILSGAPWTRTPTQLQAALLLTKGGITKCISRLEAQGLVERRPDPTDGRGVLVAATPRARKLIRTMVAEFQFGTDFVASMQMPADRRAQLAALLREMLALADAEALRRGTPAGPAGLA
ncbi:MAG TPA: MarR family transcriptional regulator [Ramlibacter sp.]|nr:MarR family transcriptional regulator [Ramlibacter sp.]